jgi:WD40 repeat protein
MIRKTMKIKHLFIFCIAVLMSLSSFSQPKTTGSYQFPTQSRIIYDLAFSASGEVLFVADHTAIKAFHFNSQRLLREFSGGHQAEIMAIALSPDSTFIASGDREGKIQVWNVASGEIINTISSHSGQILSLHISPCNKYLASGTTDNKMVLFELPAMAVINTFEDFNDHVTGVMFSPNGDWLVAVAADGRVLLANMETKTVSATQQYGAFLRGVDFDSQGTFFNTVGDDGHIGHWTIFQNGTLRLGRTSKMSPNWVTSIQNSPDGTSFVLTDIRGNIRVITPFVKMSKKIRIPVHKVVFRPGNEPYIIIVAATRGKGVVVIPGDEFKIGRL